MIAAHSVFHSVMMCEISEIIEVQNHPQSLLPRNSLLYEQKLCLRCDRVRRLRLVTFYSVGIAAGIKVYLSALQISFGALLSLLRTYLEIQTRFVVADILHVARHHVELSNNFQRRWRRNKQDTLGNCRHLSRDNTHSSTFFHGVSKRNDFLLFGEGPDCRFVRR